LKGWQGTEQGDTAHQGKDGANYFGNRLGKEEQKKMEKLAM
jgi:hypothetical protein